MYVLRKEIGRGSRSSIEQAMRGTLQRHFLSGSNKIWAVVDGQNVCQSQFRGHGVREVFQPKVLSTRKPFPRFFASSEEALTEKKCVPCNSKDIRPMSDQSASKLIQKIPGWSLQNESGTLKLQQSWTVKSFTKGLEFFQLVSSIIWTICCGYCIRRRTVYVNRRYPPLKVSRHHPDLHLVGWNNVKIDIWTHSAGGLTENDFILAAKINALDLEPLLRRKAMKRAD